MNRYAAAAAVAVALGIGAALAPRATTAEGTGTDAASDPTGLVALEEPGSPFVAFSIWVKAGSQDDPSGKEGLANLTANLLSDGSTASRGYEEILEALYPMATGYGYSTDKEMTVFRGRVHRDNLDAYYELFRESILAPAFREEDFERVKSRILNDLERTRRYGRDEELSKELLFSMAYEGTPYAHPEEGYVESVRSITLDDVKAFYRERYLRNNLVVGVAGGYPAGFAREVRADFDALPRGEVVVPPAPEPEMPDGVEVLLVEKDVDSTPISMGFPIDLLRGDPDFPAMMTVNSWFGEHRNSFSRLYQVIRETRGMNYGDYSYIEAFPLGYTTQLPPVNVGRRSQLFEIWIRPISRTTDDDLHDRTLFATRAAWRELDELVTDGLPAAEVERTQAFLRNYTVNWAASLSRRLAYAIDDVFYGIGGDGFLASIRPEIAELGPEEVNAAIRRHLQHRKMWVVMITADAEEMKRKLVEGVETPITYAGARPESVLAEDEEIASYPIPVDADDVTIVPIDEVFQRGR